MEIINWKRGFLLVYAAIFVIEKIECQKQHGGCPSQELILPCRCLVRDKEYQVWCSHSDLPRVLEGLKALGQYITRPIDELILENNNLPSLPGKAFIPLKVMRLMLRFNSLERVSNGWLAGLEDSLMELYIVEPDLRSLPEESLHNLRSLEAVTIKTNLMKRLPEFSNLPKLRHLQIESLNLVELSPRHFRNLESLEKVHITSSPRLERLEAGLLQDLPRLRLVNISHCGIMWIHLRSITRLPLLTELSLVGNKIVDAGMVGRAARELPALEIIRLDHNNIARIGEAAFVDLPAIKKLHMSFNNIEELHHGAFHRVPMLRTLNLNNNQLRRVHPESFLQHSGSGLEELFLMHNDISHVAELRSLLDTLPRLIFLDMSHNNLEAIPYGALRGHAAIEELHLDYNKIHAIEREAFMAMPALRELRLKNNSLTDRLETPFWNLPALKGLDLSGNFFRRIESRLLSNIPSLRKIDLSSNDINSVDPASFMLTPNLELVNLSNNALATLHPATFRHLLGLYELDVSFNGLLEFIPGLPRGIEYLHIARNMIGSIPPPPTPDLDLPALKMLDVSSNGIQRILGGTLRTLPQLKRLYLGRNALQQVEENSLVGLNKLEVLDLRENRISKIHPIAFKGMSELHEINLRENRLDILIPDIFRTTVGLKKLDISKNQLTEILPGTLEHARNIEELDASHNALVQLPLGLQGLTTLKSLDLTDNRLKHIVPEMLNSLSGLEVLRMSHNFIQVLRANAFSKLRNLQLLQLDNNELVEMDSRAINTMPSLKVVRMSNNRLREIPSAAFSDLPALQMVELQDNDMRLVHSNAFHQVPHLLMLNLSYNHIVGLEDAGLRSLRSLEMLDLSNNQLGMVASPSLEKMEWLVELRMDNNKICSVNGATFNGMPRLRVLSLKNNKMMTFPEHAVQKLRGNIAVLDIDGNPLACTCSILWLRAWLQEQSVMGPRCLDGSLLRELRLSRQECLQEIGRADPVAPGCEAELQSVSNPYNVQQIQHTQHWMNIRDNRTQPENTNSLAPSPEESEYFYDEYVDYPYNETSLNIKEITTKSTPTISSHYITGDTPVIYAASNSKNKTKPPDTPKGVAGSPSSSGFTFFGLPLPSLNLKNFLGGNVRMDDHKAMPQIAAASMTAERKAAIVNSPPRLAIPEKPHMRPPPDLPARPIIGMMPPTHPEIHTGGFVPVVPGSSGGFTPIIPKINKTISANIERVNLTQATSATNQIHSTIPPKIDPNTQASGGPQSFLSKRGPLPIATTTTTSTTTTTTTKSPETTTIIEEEEDDDDEDYEESIEEPKVARVQEIEQIKNLSTILNKITTLNPDIEIATGSSGSFEDIFKEVVENVPLPPAMQPVANQTSNIEQLLPDLVPSFTTNQKVETIDKKEVIGTPLSALLIPGGQQPQFRQASITKVVSPNGPVHADSEEEITPQAHSREAKNGFGESTTEFVMIKGDDNMNWYFANYNKTNLEPYVGDEPYSAGVVYDSGLSVCVAVLLVPFML